MQHEKPFYDEYPFDWFEGEAYEAVLARLLRRSLEVVRAGDMVVDVGCGPGRVIRYLTSRGRSCVGVDISQVSLRLMRSLTNCPAVAADNLRLPLADRIADFVVSDGVIHHTDDPQRAFLEDCRILKEGGHLYLGVYRPTGRYRFIMRWIGSPIRGAMRSRMGRLSLDITLVPAYYLLHKIRSRGKRTYSRCRRLFYGYFGTPIIRFHSYDEVVGHWFRAGGMSLVEYDPDGGGGVHCFLARKQTA